METAISKITELLEKDPEVLLVYLFGSTASGTSHALSDVDIAVLLVPGDTQFYLSKERELFTRLAEQGIENADVVLLNVAGVELRYNVIATGQLLFARSEQERALFEERVLLDYFHDKPFFDEYDAVVSQRLKATFFGR